MIGVYDGSRHVTTVHTTYGVYPSQSSSQPIGRFFNGSQESRVGLDSGLLRDIWVVIQPNTTPLAKTISQGNVKFAKALDAANQLPVAQRAGALRFLFAERDKLIVALVHRFVAHPWTSQFLIEVSPLVTWLWIGGIIAALGALISLSPVTPRRRRSDGGPGDGAGRLLEPGRGVATGAPPARERELVTRLTPPDPAA